MAFFTQTRFPRLWSLFQWCCGGTIDKRRLACLHLESARRVLEVGCATGNVAAAFAAHSTGEYVGVDIDGAALAVARQRFAAREHMQFVHADLAEYARSEPERFDGILFAGVLHHVDDDTALQLFQAARALCCPAARLVVSDPVQPEAGDPWLVQRFIHLEQGAHVRSQGALEALVAADHGWAVEQVTCQPVGATPLSWPVVARFLVAVLRPEGNDG